MFMCIVHSIYRICLHSRNHRKQVNLINRKSESHNSFEDQLLHLTETVWWVSLSFHRNTTRPSNHKASAAWLIFIIVKFICYFLLVKEVTCDNDYNSRKGLFRCVKQYQLHMLRNLSDKTTSLTAEIETTVLSPFLWNPWKVMVQFS